MRLLIVEDDEKIASFLKKGLKESGFAVDVVNDGESGLIICENVEFDVAVIDIMLPGIDGLELIENLRAKKINIPVLILSAKRTVDDRIKGIQRGGDYFFF